MTRPGVELRSTRRLASSLTIMPIDLVIVNKKVNLPNSGLCCPADRRIKLKESEKKGKYLDLAKKFF